MVNGRTNISMKTNFLIISMLMNIPVLLLHICQGGGGGAITFEMGTRAIHVDGFEK